MWASVAAITRYSAATSSSMSCMTARYSRYFSVTNADRDVEDVELVLLAKVQQQIERPLELRELHRPRRCASVEGLAIGHD